MTPEKMANALVQAGKMGDAGVKAGLAVVGAEGAVAGAVIAAPTVTPAVSSTASQVITTVNTVSTQAYVATTSALTAAGTAINNAYAAGQRFVVNAAYTVETLKSGGGGIKAVADVIQGATSNSRVPPNKFGAIGLAVSKALEYGFGIKTRP